MPKLRHETEAQYVSRTATVREKYLLISGSTTAAGILGYTHSMATTPTFASATYVGTTAYLLTPHNLDANTIDFKVTFTGSALASTGVTASVILKN